MFGGIRQNSPFHNCYNYLDPLELFLGRGQPRVRSTKPHNPPDTRITNYSRKPRYLPLLILGMVVWPPRRPGIHYRWSSQLPGQLNYPHWSPTGTEGQWAAIIHLRQPSRQTNLSFSFLSSIISEPQSHSGKWPLLSDLFPPETDFVNDLWNPNPKSKKISKW